MIQRRQIALATMVGYGVGVVTVYRVTGRYAALRPAARTFLAVGWPGIVAGVGLAYLAHVIREGLS